MLTAKEIKVLEDIQAAIIVAKSKAPTHDEDITIKVTLRTQDYLDLHFIDIAKSQKTRPW